MPNHVHETDFTRTTKSFEYHLEDMDCNLCKYWRGKKNGCSRTVCCCEDERAYAIAHGRIKRKKRWKRWDRA